MTTTRTTRTGLARALALLVAAASMAAGLGLVVLAFTVGDCAAFGGRCPATPPPLWEDDVAGMAATGAVLLTAVPLTAVHLLVTRPSRRRLAVALAVAAFAAVIVGLVARSSAYD